MTLPAQPLDGSSPAIPTSSVYIENDGFYTLRGESKHTDGSGNTTALAGMSVVDPLPTGTNSIGQVTSNAGSNLNTSALALEAGGNLATIAGAVSSSKVATKAASGDFADGAIATLGLKADTAITDSTTTNTAMSFIKGVVKILADIWDSTNHLIHQNIKQIGGTAVDTNSGTKSGGTQRVVLATDQPALTNALKVQLDSITAALSQTNQVPVSPAGQQGLLTLTGSLSANADNAITFSGNSTVARRIRIQNESGTTIYWNTDAAASAGTPGLPAPGTNAAMVEWLIVACTTLHIFIPTGGTTTLNGSGGVKISAWA